MTNWLSAKWQALWPEYELDEQERAEHERDLRELMRKRWRTWGAVFVLGHMFQAIFVARFDPQQVNPTWRLWLVVLHTTLTAVNATLLLSTLSQRSVLRWVSDRIGPILQSAAILSFALISINAQRTHGSVGPYVAVLVAVPFAFRASTRHFALIAAVGAALLSVGVRLLQPSLPMRTLNINTAIAFTLFAIGTARVYNQSVVRERQARSALRHYNERLAVEVAEKTAQIRALADRLDAALEDERRRLAQDLHDDLGQELLAIRLDLVALGKRLAGGGHEISIARMSAALDRSHKSVRSILESLRPRILDEEGLESAARWLAGQFSERTGCAIEVRIALYDEPHPVVGLAAFRVLQESLTNVARHARATAVSLALEGGDRDVTIEVRDNGAHTAPIRAGRGLRGMHERVQALHGTLAIERDDANQQTVVRVSLPVQPPSSAITPSSARAPSP
ncbi:MAG: sensor histidine kinase [Polyangiales bacterium]